jgi:hypothetical protein
MIPPLTPKFPLPKPPLPKLPFPPLAPYTGDADEAPPPPSAPPPAAPSVPPPWGQPLPVYEVRPGRPETAAPTAPAPTDRVAALLDMAEKAARSVRAAIDGGEADGAGDAERARASVARACLDELGKASGQIDPMVSELAAAKKERRDARLTAPQIGALEAFARCAARVAEAGAAPGAPWLTALVGTVVPLIAAVAVAA